MNNYKNHVLVVIALGLVFFFAYTEQGSRAHGGNTSNIHACVNNSSGTIKIIAADATCQNNETPLDWNAAAVVGVTGPEVVSSSTSFLPLVHSNTVPPAPIVHIVNCPTGKKATGGGANVLVDIGGEVKPSTEVESLGYTFSMSAPTVGSGGPDGWTSAIHNVEGSTPDETLLYSLTVYVICVGTTS